MRYKVTPLYMEYEVWRADLSKRLVIAFQYESRVIPMKLEENDSGDLIVEISDEFACAELDARLAKLSPLYDTSFELLPPDAYQHSAGPA